MAKKMIAWLLVVVLTAGIAIGGTLAYLTDRDSEANVFTTGDVNIDLNEDFEQGSTLIPGVDIEKEPTVTNVGPNEAWVWTTVAVPEGLESVIIFDDSGEGWKEWTKGEKTVEIDGKNYVIYTILHEDALAVGDETTALFTKVTLDETVDIDPDGKWHTVEGGTATELGWTNADGNPVIHVSAYAVQKEGFDTVEAAYAAYQTQWGDNGTEYEAPPEGIQNYAELRSKRGVDGDYFLGQNIDAEDIIFMGNGTTVSIDLNGKTINALKEGQFLFGSQGGNKLTLDGDGVINCGKGFMVSKNKSEITVNGGTYTMTGYGTLSGTKYNSVIQGDAKMVINAGTFTTNVSDAVLFFTTSNGVLEINGGFFENTANKTPDLISMGTSRTSTNRVIIKGGTFVNWNPLEDRMTYTGEWPANGYEAFVGPWIIVWEGYKVVSETQANGDVWYTVVKA